MAPYRSFTTGIHNDEHGKPMSIKELLWPRQNTITVRFPSPGAGGYPAEEVVTINDGKVTQQSIHSIGRAPESFTSFANKQGQPTHFVPNSMSADGKHLIYKIPGKRAIYGLWRVRDEFTVHTWMSHIEESEPESILWAPGCQSLAFSSTTVAEGKIVRIMDIHGYYQQYSIQYQLQQWSPDDNYMLARDESTSYILDMRTAQLPACAAVSYVPTKVVWAPNATWVAFERSEELSDLWELETGHGQVIQGSDCVFNNLGNRVVFRTRLGVSVYNLETRKLVNLPEWEQASYSYSPDGKHIAVYEQDRFTLLSVQGASVRQTLTSIPPKGASYVAFSWSPNGRYIAVAVAHSNERSHVETLDARSFNRRVYDMQSTDFRIRRLAWSPDSEYIAVAGMRRVYIIPF